MKESPLGEYGLYKIINKTQIHKKGFDTIERETLAYSLYKYAEYKGVHALRISDLYTSDNDRGVYREFGLTRSTIEQLLRSLNSDEKRVLIAELNMGLDSVTLKEGLTSLTCLQQLTA